jgi:ABC-2 type transport system permease protein
MWNNDILLSISSGSIGYELTRPLNLYGKWFAECLALRFSRAILRCVPVLLLAFLLPRPYGAMLPASAFTFFAFTFSLFLTVFVVVAMSMFIYIGSIHLLESAGLRNITMSVMEFLTGAIIPIPFFPEPFRTIANLLPFGAMQNVPLRIYSGDITGSEMYTAILLQIFWLLVLLITGNLFMKRSLKYIIVQGG